MYTSSWCDLWTDWSWLSATTRQRLSSSIVMFGVALLPGWGISQARSLAAGQISQAEMFRAVSHPDQVRASTVRVDNWLKNWKIRNLFNWPYCQESYNLKLCLGFSTAPRSEEEPGCTLATLSPSLLGNLISFSSWSCHPNFLVLWGAGSGTMPQPRRVVW